MVTVSERTFGSERTLGHFPVAAYFSFELLLEITLSSDNFPWLDWNDIEIGEAADLILLFIKGCLIS